ncbi:small GTP-binding protein [Histomonas meleagridis]|uniref:small GTP-binding protein n=1 Tax=Histomonas meleagridis TaxID=135588 RepID=UPI00355982F4|nr:small GTP-binding protein [Histomonas meleagridis]KAH0806080.1 small GTP-binding protein [Histomonas meleagridis]
MADCKIVVFGSGGVGKSALTIQFVQGYFITDYDPTIEDSYRRVLLVDDQNVQLDILDTAGQGDFAPMRTSYMRQGKGFIIVYSIDDRSSFEEAEEFYNDIIRTKGTNKIPIVICGNKCDLEDKRVISKIEGEELAGKFGASFFETSALSNLNIEEAFVTLARQIVCQNCPQKTQEEKTKTKPKKKKSFKCNLI